MGAHHQYRDAVQRILVACSAFFAESRQICTFSHLCFQSTDDSSFSAKGVSEMTETAFTTDRCNMHDDVLKHADNFLEAPYRTSRLCRPRRILSSLGNWSYIAQVFRIILQGSCESYCKIFLNFVWMRFGGV